VADRPPLVVVSSDPAAEAAARVARALRLTGGRSPRLAVAGGSALTVLGPLRRALGEARWSQVRLTWVDERCVPSGDADSNRGAAARDGQLDPAQPPAVELALFLDGEDPVQACQRVSAALRARFAGKLDVILLGMGEDGHIASLFPGRPELAAKEPVVAILDSPKPPAQRITLTLPMLATARVAVLLATGEAKRSALERLVRRDPALPASALNKLTIVTDLALGGDQG
jgi:6-phosphogluconolactonase